LPSLSTSGVGRILVWGAASRRGGGEAPKAPRGWGAGRRGGVWGGGSAPSPEIFLLFNLEMAHFDAHLK